MIDLKLTRRHFVVATSAAAGATLTGVSTARAAVPALRAYHDATLAQHEANYAAWPAQGYRPVTVSIYGTTAAPAFAAVWIQRTGPDWVMGSNMTAADFQSFFDICAAFGYRMTQISAMGAASDPRFVAVAEVSSIGIPLTRHLLRSGADNNEANIQFWLRWARTNNQIPKSIAIYGTAADPRYAVVFEPNSSGMLWNADGLNETGAQYQARFNAQWDNLGRPWLVPVSPDRRYASMFRGDQLTQGWIARHDLTAAGYQAEFDTQIAAGNYPIQVAGGGSGSSRRFSALFVPTESIASRALTRRGDARSTRIDTAMESILSSSRVRQATLAVVRNRTLIYARTFTRAEAGYPIATPTTFFRMASCSKTLTAMLIMRLIQEGRIALTDRMQTHLNLRRPNGSAPLDARFGNITIRQLLLHQSGLTSFPSAQAVVAAHGTALPATKAQTAAYLASLNLDFTPGSTSAYSNAGYMLLGMIIERITGQSYLTALRGRIFTPLGATRVRRFSHFPESQPSDEAKYDSTELNCSTSVVTSDGRLVPHVYGGDFDSRVWDASGGLSVAAPDFAKVLASLNLRTGNPVLDPTRIDLMLNNSFGFDGVSTGPRKGWKGGAIWGQSSNVHFEEGGLSFVICFNKDNTGGSWYPDFAAMRTAVANTVFPTADLFPSFGIPSF